MQEIKINFSCDSELCVKNVVLCFRYPIATETVDQWVNDLTDKIEEQHRKHDLSCKRGYTFVIPFDLIPALQGRQIQEREDAQRELDLARERFREEQLRAAEIWAVEERKRKNQIEAAWAKARRENVIKKKTRHKKMTQTRERWVQPPAETVWRPPGGVPNREFIPLSPALRLPSAVSFDAICARHDFETQWFGIVHQVRHPRKFLRPAPIKPKTKRALRRAYFFRYAPQKKYAGMNCA